MTAAPRESALRFVARLLDGAIHDTIRHGWPLIVPFALVEFFGDVFGQLPLPLNVAYMAVYIILQNRCRAVMVAALMRDGGKRIDWRDASRSWPSLWFALPSPVEVAPVVVGFLMISGPVVNSSANRFLLELLDRPLLAALSFVGYEMVCVVALVVSAPLLLACIAAGMDVVVDRSAPWPALKRWIRYAFRRRTIVSTTLCGFIYSAAFTVTKLILGAIWTQQVVVHASIFCLPNAVSDLLPLLFVWHWRSATLDRERGADLASMLDGEAGEPRHSSVIPSP